MHETGTRHDPGIHALGSGHKGVVADALVQLEGDAFDDGVRHWILLMGL